MIATVENKLDAIRHALPSEALFADKDWLISPDAFPISEKFASELEQLGHRLFVFQRACNQLYQLSVRGKQPAWIAQYLDAGKPARDVYRFFELFDLPNIPKIEALLRSAAERKVRVTPPLKPFLEEKMWFALFWLKPLRQFWRRELGDKYFLKLQQVIPYTWLLDPTPLPQHAVIPRLEIHDWREAAKFSQKERDLLLKVSGFSPLGWGSRGVALGADLPHSEWEKRIDHALTNFAIQPTILQQFHKGSLFEHPYYDGESGEVRTMKGRIRLCPYYFVEDDRVKLRGALTTIVPADKKLIHGMRDGIMVPTSMNTVNGPR